MCRWRGRPARSPPLPSCWWRPAPWPWHSWTQQRAAAIIEDQRRQLEFAAHLRLQIIEALSLAIDARHRTTQSIRREQSYAMALARSFGMPDDEIEGVRTAALLHDVGQTRRARPHPDQGRPARRRRSSGRSASNPQVGAGIIAGVPFPYPVASLVLCHHERWDGTGYPSGLQRARKIPLGARILACVDHYEALTSDRPFHRAMPAREAMDVLWARGRQGSRSGGRGTICRTAAVAAAHGRGQRRTRRAAPVQRRRAVLLRTGRTTSRARACATSDGRTARFTASTTCRGPSARRSAWPTR